MAVVLTEDTQIISSHVALRDLAPSARDTAVELGIWLGGIDSFVKSGPKAAASADTSNCIRQVRILNASLLRSSMLTAKLLDPANTGASIDGLDKLARAMRDLIFASSSFADEVEPAGYKAWCSTVSLTLRQVPVVAKLIALADAEGGNDLPRVLLDLTRRSELEPELAELALVLPRFGRILRNLSVVGGMLERDEPLKPAVLILSRVEEMVRDLTAFINSRLERFHDRDADMFASLDAASYTAAMELKKVFSQELTGVSEIRPVPSVYARMETAYASLNDGFKLILSGFAKIVDPQSDMFSVFPEFGEKRERSKVLYRDLGELIKNIQSAESAPDSYIEPMRERLDHFMAEPVSYLFYKDTETVERFVEEIRAVRDGNDIVPLLHRFGAYLDTLLGQVSLRAVLVDQI